MNPVQIQLQTVLNERINQAIADYLETHPDTELDTIIRALGDAKQDAGKIFEEAAE